MARRSTSRKAARRRTSRTRNRISYTRADRSLYRRRLRLEPLEDRRVLAVVTVNTLDDTVDFDDGVTSLREAIFATNTVAGADTIEFAPSLFENGPGTILLTQGELVIMDELTISGPGASLLTIDAQQQSRIFNITATTGDFAIAGLTLTGGRTTGGSLDDGSFGGGAIRSTTLGLLTIIDAAVDHNSTTGDSASGGGIFALGSLEIVRSAITNNRTAGSYAKGGGIFVVRGLTISESVISGNQTEGVLAYGGGISVAFGPAVITNSTIRHNGTAANSTPGGGVHVLAGSIAITGSRIADNWTFGDASAGGGLQTGRDVKIVESTITHNRTSGSNSPGGGIHIVGSGLGTIDATITRSTFSENSTFGRGSRGGGISSGVPLTVTDSFVSNNLTSGVMSHGGGIFAAGRTELSESIIVGNRTAGMLASGGGIYSLLNLSVNRTTITGNQSLGIGGGISAQSVELDRSIVSDNTSIGGGGVSGLRVTLTATTVSNNRVIGDQPRGAGVLASNLATVTDSVISGNVASGGVARGGGLYSRGLVSLTRSAITDNFASGDRAYGGGVSGGSVTLTESLVSKNVASGANPRGGGVSGTQVTMFYSTLSGNSAVGEGAYGGGVYSRSQGLNVSQSTITGNIADGLGARGGGAFAHHDIAVKYSTISANRAQGGDAQGGGIAADSARVVVSSSIIAGNVSLGGHPDVHIGFGSQTFTSSLIGSNDGTILLEAQVGSPDANGNLIGGPVHGVIDPLLGPLADNGGFVLPDGSRIWTHALLPGSPAINAGDLNAVAGVGGVPEFDQRGAPFSRVFGGRIDIGAFEYQEPSDLNLLVDTLVDESDGDYSRGDLSLREAIELANLYSSVDTIRFDPALWANGPATILLTQGELVIADSLTIEGPGADLLTIDASGNDPTPDQNNGDGSRVINIDDGDFAATIDVSINGLTLTGGDVAGSGGAILARENLSLIDSTVRTNFATQGGGGINVVNYGGTVTIARSEIHDNSVAFFGDRGVFGGGSGGIFSRGASVAVISSTFSGNTGGGVEIVDFVGDVTILGSRISDNRGANTGGINLRSGGGSVVISDTIVSQNVNAQSVVAAGVHLQMRAGSSAVVERSEIIDNVHLGPAYSWRPGGNGGLSFSGVNSSLIVRDSSIRNNSAAITGGVFVSGGTAAIERTEVRGNHAIWSGGGIGSFGAVLSIVDSLIADNTAGVGGGISFRPQMPGPLYSVVVRRSTVTGNMAVERPGVSPLTGLGGGIYGIGISVIDSTIAGNTAASGGGIWGAEVELVNSTLFNNSADTGGGAWLEGGIVWQSTISQNTANLAGGIYAGDTVQVVHSTVTDNRATGLGGGVFVAAGSLDLDHTIVAGNFGTYRDLTGVIGTSINARFSLIGNSAGSGLTPSPVDTPDTDGNLIGGTTTSTTLLAGLSYLGDNGGPTMTHALLPGSPAIDAGDPGAVAGMEGVPAFDQRGAPFSRVFGGRIDIGAVESQPILAGLPGDFNNDGVVGNEDLTLLFNHWAEGVPPTPAGWSGAPPTGPAVDNDELTLLLNHWGMTAGGAGGDGATLVERADLRADGDQVVEGLDHDVRRSSIGAMAESLPAWGDRSFAVGLTTGRMQGEARNGTSGQAGSGTRFGAARQDRLLEAWLAMGHASSRHDDSEPWESAWNGDTNDRHNVSEGAIDAVMEQLVGGEF